MRDACASAKQITGTANRADQRPLAGHVDFLTETPHMHVDQIGAGIETAAPYRFENHRACQHLARVPHHEFEHTKFGGLQFEFALAVGDPASHEVELQHASA